MQSKNQSPADRLSAARSELDRNRAERDSARGTPRELSTAVDLQSAETEVQAREAWLRYIDRTDDA